MIKKDDGVRLEKYFENDDFDDPMMDARFNEEEDSIS